MKDCFESKDIGLLAETIKKMPEDQAKYHMKRCVDSGLWVPESKDNEGVEEVVEEEIYEEAKLI